MAKETEKLTLTETVIAEGVYYGPGEAEVPVKVATYLRERSPSSIAVQGAAQQPTHDDPLAEFPQLREAGFTSVERVRAASDEELLALPGIGAATLKKLRDL